MVFFDQQKDEMESKIQQTTKENREKDTEIKDLTQNIDKLEKIECHHDTKINVIYAFDFKR